MLYIYQLMGKKPSKIPFLLSSQPHSVIVLWLTRTGFWSNK